MSNIYNFPERNLDSPSPQIAFKCDYCHCKEDIYVGEAYFEMVDGSKVHIE